MVFDDILAELERANFNSFSLDNVLIFHGRDGALRAKLGLNCEPDIAFHAPAGASSAQVSVWGAGICLFFMTQRKSPYNDTNDSREIEGRSEEHKLNQYNPCTDVLFK